MEGFRRCSEEVRQGPKKVLRGKMGRRRNKRVGKVEKAE